jgi:hypothetical protein
MYYCTRANAGPLRTWSIQYIEVLYNENEERVRNSRKPDISGLRTEYRTS